MLQKSSSNTFSRTSTSSLRGLRHRRRHNKHDSRLHHGQLRRLFKQVRLLSVSRRAQHLHLRKQARHLHLPKRVRRRHLLRRVRVPHQIRRAQLHLLLLLKLQPQHRLQSPLQRLQPLHLPQLGHRNPYHLPVLQHRHPRKCLSSHP